MSQIYLGLSDYLYRNIWPIRYKGILIAKLINFDASKNLGLKCQPSFFSVNFLDMGGIINEYTIWCFVGKTKYPIKTFHGKNQK